MKIEDGCSRFLQNITMSVTLLTELFKLSAIHVSCMTCNSNAAHKTLHQTHYSTRQIHEIVSSIFLSQKLQLRPRLFRYIHVSLILNMREFVDKRNK